MENKQKEEDLRFLLTEANNNTEIGVVRLSGHMVGNIFGS